MPGFLLRVLLLCCLPMLGWASVALTDISGGSGVRPRIEVLQDPSASLGIDDVTRAGAAFEKAVNPLGLGYTSSAVWIRLSMTRTTGQPVRWWLEVAPPHLNQVSLFVPHEGDGSAFTRIDGGNAVPVNQRWLEHPVTVLPFDLPSTDPQTLYLRVSHSGLFIADITAWQPQDYLEHAAWVSLLQGGYYGIWVVIILGNLAYWFVYRPDGYHWWLLCQVAEAAQVVSANGVATFYFFPAHPEFAQPFSLLVLGMAVATSCMFWVHIFELNASAPGTARFFRGAAVVAFMLPIGGLIGVPQHVASPPLQYVGITTLTLAFVVSLWRLRLRESRHWIYALALLLLEIGYAVAFLRNRGVLPPSPLVVNLWQINLLAHIVLANIGILQSAAKVKHVIEKLKTEKAVVKGAQEYVLMVAHELKNPLASLDAIIQGLMTRREDDVERTNRRLARLSYIVRRIESVIERHVAYGRIQGGGFAPDPEDVDIAELLSQTVASYRNMDTREVQLEMAEPHLLARLDPQLLRVVFWNLLDNAFKYSPPGETVLVSLRRSNGASLELRVHNSGAPLPSESLGRVFEPYFRAPGTAKIRGSGLGLAIVKRIVALHGGEVDFTSSREQGTTVTIRLPLAPASGQLQQVV